VRAEWRIDRQRDDFSCNGRLARSDGLSRHRLDRFWHG
jgi:hypothetical protein